MNKPLKYALFGLGGIILLLIAIVAVVAATFDPNDYKPLIVKLVQEKKQRTLNIQGDIELAFWPKIGADLGKITLSERNSEEQFASVDGLKVSLALLPLLKKELVVDTIYVDGPYAYGARDDVARVAGNYGLLVAAGAPMSAGAVPPGTVRVIVARTRASVPDCPNWERPAQPSIDHVSMPNFGCGVNGALAAMVANPQDLVHGREGSGVGDNRTAVKAVDSYRKAAPTGTSGAAASWYAR